MILTGLDALCPNVMRGYSDHPRLTRPKEEVTREGGRRRAEGCSVGGLELKEVKLGGGFHGLRGPWYCVGGIGERARARGGKERGRSASSFPALGPCSAH